MELESQDLHLDPDELVNMIELQLSELDMLQVGNFSVEYIGQIMALL